jgi:TolB-like protein
MIIIAFNAGSALGQPAKLAVVPFKIFADRDLGFLQRGLSEMITSRLGALADVEVIETPRVMTSVDPEQLPESAEAARAIGKELDATHVLYGSLVSFGDSASIDARMVVVDSDEAAKPFYVQTAGLGDVIPQVSTLVDQIGRQIYGQSTAQVPAPAAPPPSSAMAQGQVDSRMHPEKLFKQAPSEGGTFAAGDATVGDPGASIFTAPAEQTTVDRRYWRSQSYDMLFVGLAVGDTSGDGRNEVVVVTPHTLHVYRVEAGRLIAVFEGEKERARHHVGVDVADLNGNGRAEIFISALNAQRDAVQSKVMEFDGQTYKAVVEKSPWFFRAVGNQGDTNIPLLMGQRAGREGPFSETVYQMAWNGAEYVPGDPLLPKNAGNVLGATAGDLKNDGRRLFAAFNEGEAIRVIDEYGKVLATEDDKYGGSIQGFSLGKPDPGEPDLMAYLPVRLLIGDANLDEANELIVIRNIDAAGKFLQSFRYYGKFEVLGLGWDDLGARVVWQTRQMKGQLVDIAVADIDGDGQRELVTGIVTKTGRTIGLSPRSSLMVFQLGS